MQQTDPRIVLAGQLGGAGEGDVGFRGEVVGDQEVADHGGLRGMATLASPLSRRNSLRTLIHGRKTFAGPCEICQSGSRVAA